MSNEQEALRAVAKAGDRALISRTGYGSRRLREVTITSATKLHLIVGKGETAIKYRRSNGDEVGVRDRWTSAPQLLIPTQALLDEMERSQLVIQLKLAVEQLGRLVDSLPTTPSIEALTSALAQVNALIGQLSPPKSE